jgi:hypothetical protein
MVMYKVDPNVKTTISRPGSPMTITVSIFWTFEEEASTLRISQSTTLEEWPLSRGRPL